MTTSLIALGAAVLEVVGLNPQKIGSRSEGRVPVKPTFSGVDHQLTGMGEETIRLEFATVPLIMGGLDTLAIIRSIHRTQAVVPYLRLGASYEATLEGLVVVKSLDVAEERLHPLTGVGRIVHGEAELVLIGEVSAIGEIVVETGLSLMRAFA